MCNRNCYHAEDHRFNGFFGWLRVTQHCACRKWLPTCWWLQFTVNLRSCSNLSSQNWTESCDKVQKKIINSKPNLFKQKLQHPIPSIYWNVARFKSKYMFISGHFHALSIPKTRKYSIFLVLSSKSSIDKCAKLHTVAASNKRDHPTRSLYYYLFTSHIFLCCSLHTSHFLWIALSMQHQLKGCKNVPSFLQWTARIAHSFCEGCTWHHLHILVKAPFCCDWKAQAASMQSFTLWQQAKKEIPLCAHSISASLWHQRWSDSGFLLSAPILFLTNNIRILFWLKSY